MSGTKTFLRITNVDIYNKLNDIEIQNNIAHEKIILHAVETNGKVKLNRWISTTALSIIVLLIGILSKGFFR